jgi:hypothetical protein
MSKPLRGAAVIAAALLSTAVLSNGLATAADTTLTLQVPPTVEVGSTVTVKSTLAPATDVGYIFISAKDAKEHVLDAKYIVPVNGVATLNFTPTDVGPVHIRTSYQVSGGGYLQQETDVQVTPRAPMAITLTAPDTAPTGQNFTSTATVTPARPNTQITWEYSTAGSGVFSLASAGPADAAGTATTSFGFNDPGTYIVRATATAPAPDQTPVVAEHLVTVTGDPIDQGGNNPFPGLNFGS